MKIKAAVLEVINRPLVIKEISPTKLRYGQVLVKIAYSGVCRSQLMEVQGKRGEDKWLPHLLGHEAVGEVVATGGGVTKVGPGDSVILTWIKGEGIDAQGAIYKDGDRIINSGPITTFSNYSVVSENRLVKCPDFVDESYAALFGCAIPTGGGIVINELSATTNCSIAIVGLGGVGISALVTLLARGHSNITAFDVNPLKLEFAAKLGAHKTVLTRGDLQIGPQQKIKKYAHCIEAAGTAQSIEFAFSLLAANGHLVFASHPPVGHKITLDPHELISGKSIRGSWGGSTRPDTDIEKLCNILCDSKPQLRSLANKVYPLDRINEALLDLKTERVFRPMIKMEH